MSQWQATFRQLIRRPGFAVIAVLLLAAAIGVNTTVFTVLESVLLKPLPYPDADRLMAVLEANPSKNQNASLIAPIRLEDWNRLNRTFVAISGVYADSVTDKSGSMPERLSGLRVAPRFFQVYGRKPAIGRVFDKREETFGGPLAAVISFGLWTRRYHSDPAVLGSRLLLGDQAYTIVGVMPLTFGSPTTDVWLPAPLTPFFATARASRFLTGIGRLRPGVTEKQAQEDLERVQKQLAVQYPDTDKDWTALVENKKRQVVAGHAQAIWLAFAGTSFLLVLTSINIASLLVGRIYQRERELAVRASLGASRWQVVSLILKEVGLIVLAGTGLGLFCSYSSVDFIAKQFGQVPRMNELTFDGTSASFGAAIGLLIFLAMAALPTLQKNSSRLSEILAQSGRSQIAGRHPIQRYLLAGQFALTVILLCSSGLLLRTYSKLANAATGFDAHQVVTFHVGAEWGEDRRAIGTLQQRIIDELSGLPGVEAVGLTNFLPTDEATLRYQYRVSGEQGAGAEKGLSAGARLVTSGYLAALRIPILQGKNCPVMEGDLSKPGWALVNRAFAEQFVLDHTVIGRHISLAGVEYPGSSAELIGVVGNVREDSANLPAAPYVYMCAAAGGWPDPEYVVRTREGAAAITAAIRARVHQIAPTRAVFAMKTMDEHVAEQLGQPLLTAKLLTAFAIAALTLASFGLYSLMSLTVAAQTRDIGTRIALGADRGQVLGEVFGRAARWMAAGVALGIVGAVGAGHLLRSLLFGVAPEDPLTLAVVSLVLVMTWFVATLIPALRAAAVDPIEALRTQ